MEAKNYNIELRDKDGNLKAYLTPFASEISWEWNRMGGCGNARMTINKAYRSINFQAHDDIQIRIREPQVGLVFEGDTLVFDGSPLVIGATSKLVYRGFIDDVVSSLKSPQSIVLSIRGYFDILSKVVIHDSGDIKTYSGQNISAIAESIVDNFVVTKTPVTKGDIEAGDFSVDSIEFMCPVGEALKTLAELGGNIEYGVNERLEFFWKVERDTVRQRFFVGNNIELLERRIDWSKLVNKTYLKGGNVNDVPYLKTAEVGDSQTSYFLSEEILNNSSIITDVVADQYLGIRLKEKATPSLNIKIKVPNTPLRLEDSLPLGLVSVYDSDYDQDLYIVGSVADGGDGIIVGSIGDGGSGAIVGGTYTAQVDRITYGLSNTPQRFNIEIVLGDIITETAALLKRLESELNAVTQRS